jgi:hypothetical protein
VLSTSQNILLTQSALYIGEEPDGNDIPKTVRQVALAQVTRVEPY